MELVGDETTCDVVVKLIIVFFKIVFIIKHERKLIFIYCLKIAANIADLLKPKCIRLYVLSP